MSQSVIKVEKLSKLYRLGVVGTGTLSHDLNRWWHRVRGKEDPYSKVGETNVRETGGDSEYVWALKDINFEVEQGEVLGIIGKNGAGKSTLLKILSKVTGPTSGTIKAKGRIASLLEVGTGFHPELTGRENIYLNGTILGMTRAEVSRKLDEIVEFAGVARYVDTPVKRYSSGMKVRLGFAVAAHLEPEILIVDEVLAVGDAEFQKKAVGKMQEVSHKGGRTVLFVSHNMASIQNLCNRLMVLEDGSAAYIGEVEAGVNFYLGSYQDKQRMANWNERLVAGQAQRFAFTELHIKTSNGKIVKSLTSGIRCSFVIHYSLRTELKIKGVRLLIIDFRGVIRIVCNTGLVGATPRVFRASERGTIEFIFDNFPLPKGRYYAQISCFSEDGMEDDVERALEFDVEGGDFYKTGQEAQVKDGVLVHYGAVCRN